MKVGMILLGEAGNYGDDLILLAVLHAVAKSGPGSQAAYLSFGNNIPIEEIRDQFGLPLHLVRVKPPRDLPGNRFFQTRFREFDAVVVGGGGLIQTSQHSLKPYHWLRYLPDSDVPVIGVGLGIGPLSDRWKKYFSKRPSPFNELYVREEYAESLASELNWQPKVSSDFIDDTFMQEFLENLPHVAKENSLGVALRAWPNLEAEQVADHIHRIAMKHQLDTVRYFVLESKNGTGPDVEFTRQVARLNKFSDSHIHIYTSNNLVEFTQKMRLPSVAISMKLHSSAFWGNRAIPMYPIVYAPKVSDFFGMEYAGLRLVDYPVSPAPPITALRSEEALLSSLETLPAEYRASAGKPALFSFSQRLSLQLEGLVKDAFSKARRVFDR